MSNPNTTIANSLYVQANGTSLSAPFVDIFLPRDPTSNDIGPPYKTQQKWFNTLSGAYFILSGFSSVGGLQAIWSEITGVSGVGVASLQGNTGGQVFPTAGGLIQIIGDGTTITAVGNPAGHSITLSLVGGGEAIDSINVDAHTAPGTDPVVADGTGLISVTGGQVAAGTTANVIQTNSLAANTYTVQVQRSSAQASSTIGANGVSHFSSTDFTVDGNGFVAIVNGAGLSLGAFGAVPNADGLSLAAGVLNMQPADGTHPGGVSTVAQTIAGAKTFSTSVSTPEVLLTGSGSGTISILPQAAAGTYNFNLPTTAGTLGDFLTSAGGAGAPMTWTAPPASSISITGDTGGALTGNAFTFDANTNSGSTVLFSGAGTTISLNVTDANDNTFIGKTSGNLALSGDSNTSLGSNSSNSLTSGSSNTALGYNALISMQSGSTNTAIGTQAIQTASTGDSNTIVGFEALFSATSPSSNVSVGYVSLYALLTGSDNVAIGTNAGINYLGAESNNILINNNGVATENNVLRIGTGTGTGVQELNASYISGINGVNVSSSTATVVTMTSGSDQLGTATITAGSGITVTPTANTITIAASGGGGGFASINIQTLTSTGTYTPSSTSVSYVIVELVGGGGGGGGNNTAGGSGGGGGGYSRAFLPYSSVSGGVSVTIGAGGGGGASGAAGTAGGTTSFGAFLSATGGTGGNSTVSGSRGVRGGIGSSGNLNSCGGDSAPTAINDFSGSVGGSSYFGGGGAGGAGTSGSPENGFNAQNYGGGGGGGGSTDTGGSTSSGGSGAPGVCIITEYIT